MYRNTQSFIIRTIDHELCCGGDIIFIMLDSKQIYFHRETLSLSYKNLGLFLSFSQERKTKRKVSSTGSHTVIALTHHPHSPPSSHQYQGHECTDWHVQINPGTKLWSSMWLPALPSSVLSLCHCS